MLRPLNKTCLDCKHYDKSNFVYGRHCPMFKVRTGKKSVNRCVGFEHKKC